MGTSTCDYPPATTSITTGPSPVPVQAANDAEAWRTAGRTWSRTVGIYGEFKSSGFKSSEIIEEIGVEVVKRVKTGRVM